jgi:hypothetical protein
LAQQKKAKVGRPKLPRGTAKGRIVPVRFANDEIKAIVRASRAANQTISEWLRDMARLGTALQPLSPANPSGTIAIPACPDCRALVAKTLVYPMCESCKAKQTEGRSS